MLYQSSHVHRTAIKPNAAPGNEQSDFKHTPGRQTSTLRTGIHAGDEQNEYCREGC